MAVKPTDGHIDWVTDDDPAKYVEPSAAKRLQGWIAEEKPPFQYFNWAWRLIDRWLKWADAQSDENIAAIAAEATARADADTAHANATDVHGATSETAGNRIIMRNEFGRAKVASPLDFNDIARLDTIDDALGVYNPSYDDQNNATQVTVQDTQTTIVNLSLTGLVAGDVFFVNVSTRLTKFSGTAGNNRLVLNNAYGTASLSFVGGAGALFEVENYVDAGETDRQQFGGFVFVTADGDATLRLSGYSYGSNSYAIQYYNRISVTFIRKQ